MKTFWIATILTIAVAVGGSIYFRDQGLVVSKDSSSSSLADIASLAPLPVEGSAPALRGIDNWINSKELTTEDLRGKVVLYDFWTYTCINCIRTFPHLNALYDKYRDKGFVLLGVHTPEFDFEKDTENVIDATQKYGIEYPVAQDNDYATWNAFSNQYWPAHYLADVDGNIRYHHFGEGAYTQTENAVRQLLLEAGLLTLDSLVEEEDMVLASDMVDHKSIGTPEIYLGYKRINNVGNMDKGVLTDTPHTFLEPNSIESNRFYFVGTWNIGGEKASFVGDKGKLVIRYKASKLNMVLDAAGDKVVKLELKLDGEHLTDKNKGVDVYLEGKESFGRVEESRLYNLVDTDDDYGWHTLEIIITSPGLDAFTFTFG